MQYDDKNEPLIVVLEYFIRERNKWKKQCLSAVARSYHYRAEINRLRKELIDAKHANKASNT